MTDRSSYGFNGIFSMQVAATSWTDGLTYKGSHNGLRKKLTQNL